MAADIDNNSRGRFLLGVGIGWLLSEFEAFGALLTPPAVRFAALEEALSIIAGVWGPEKFAFEGEHYRIGPLQITPPPLQQPRPPLVIGGSGERRSLRLVAQYADACNVNDVAHTDRGLERVGGPELIAHKYDVVRGYCEEIGRDPGEVLRSHFTLRLVLGESDEVVAEKVAAIGQSGSGSPATRRAQPSAFMTGTPERVAAYYQSLVDVGTQYFVIQIDARDTETIELLASQVVPAVRDRVAS
jgi:alkanesulfonate monooxygenase SsuD/methylene tetrahydromethanopterin reductase-like flavin-dependent oxidoreductase (luciferase family)